MKQAVTGIARVGRIARYPQVSKTSREMLSWMN